MKLGVAQQFQRTRPKRLEDILPVESWNQIMGECLYTRGDFASTLQFEDVAGKKVEMEEEQESFKESFFLVSRTCYRLAQHILAKYLVLTAQDDIDETTFTMSDTGLGAQTERIDLRITGAYDPCTLNELFGLTPNLRVLTIRNEKQPWSMVVRYRPDAMIHAIGQLCPNLRRLQFESWGEEPTVRQVKDLLHILPRLQTLHLDALYWPAQGDEDNDQPIDFVHHHLHTLSLGSLRRKCDNGDGIERAGAFLRSCSGQATLPNLRTVHMQVGIPSLAPFLEQYGRQIRELGFSAGDLAFAEGTDWIQPDKWHPHISTYCDYLERMTLVTQDRPLAASVRPLAPLKGLKELEIVLIPPRVSTVAARGALLLALKEVERVSLPSLESITFVIASYREMVECVEGWFDAVEETEARGITITTVVLGT